MDNEPTITLHYVGKDGRRERTKLTHHTLSEACAEAKAILHAAHGLYTEVDVCTEDGQIERIQNPALASAVDRVENHGIGRRTIEARDG